MKKKWLSLRLALVSVMVLVSLLVFSVPAFAIVAKPTVTTQAASSITYNTVVLNGTITDKGGALCTYRGFRYGSVSGRYTGLVKSAKGSYDTGAYTVSLTGLTAGKTYYAKAYATNSGGSGYGTEVSFTTTSSVAPTVTSAEAASLKLTSAVFGGNITALGGKKAAYRGFEWGTATGVYTNSWISQALLGFNTGTFTRTITGLTANTTYYYKAIAANISATPVTVVFGGSGNGTEAWSTTHYNGAYSVKLVAPTGSDYARVLIPITGNFSTFVSPSFYYKIGSDAVATTEDIGGTWPIYERDGVTVTNGYLSPYIIVHIMSGQTEHWIISQPWAESTRVGWTLWNNASASEDWTEACWHDEQFTNLEGGPTDAGWEPLDSWTTEYADYTIADIKVGFGNFNVTGKQSAYVDDPLFNGNTYFLEKSSTKVGQWGFGAEKTFATLAP